MKILLTGCAGFIGYHVAKALLERGDEVHGIDSLNNYYDVKLKNGRLNELGIKDSDIKANKDIVLSKLHKKFIFQKLDISNPKKINKVFKRKRFDTVCNLAAQAGVRYSLEAPDAYIKSNVVGFMNILENCKKYNVKNLVYASSSSVYGLNKNLPFSTSHNTDHPISLYAASKKSNELMAHTYSHLFDLPTTGLRFFTVYGPWGRPDMALFKFVKAALNNEEIDIYNNGNMVRDFTFVEDIKNGVLSVIDNPASSNPRWSKTQEIHSSSAPYKIYNIGNNNPVHLMDFIDSIEAYLDLKIKKNFKKIQPGDVEKTFADIDDLAKNLEYKPKTNIQEGIKKFIDWYLKFYKINKSR